MSSTVLTLVVIPAIFALIALDCPPRVQMAQPKLVSPLPGRSKRSGKRSELRELTISEALCS